MRRFISVCAIFWLCVCGVCFGQMTYYVNGLCGNDMWDGTDPNCAAPTGPKQTIDAALQMSTDGDTIIVADGVYSGPGNKGLQVYTRVRLVSENGPTTCIIDCQGAGNFVTFSQMGYSGTLDGFKVIDGAGNYGGAVTCQMDSEPIIENCVFDNCTGNDGGAIGCEQGSRPVIRTCEFNDNSATGVGGAIYCGQESTALIEECGFSGNTAMSGGTISFFQSSGLVLGCTIESGSATTMGGGIFCANYSSPIIRETVISGCSSGGGIACTSNSSPTVMACTIMSNAGAQEGIYGGGIYCELDSHPYVIDCEVSYNHARDGGGVYCRDTSGATIEMSDITGNMASQNGVTVEGEGGGLRFTGESRVRLEHCVLSGNRAVNGGGISGGGMAVAGVTMGNCTVSGNRALSAGSGIHAVSVGVNISDSIIWGNGKEMMQEVYFVGPVTVTYSDVNAVVGGVGNIKADPQFAVRGYWDDGALIGDPADDVWVEGDYHLKSLAGRWDPFAGSWVLDDAKSPCIDAGNPAGDVGDEPAPNGERVNMGAYGGTAEASKSEFCAMALDGDVNGDCKVDNVDFAMLAANWLECNMIPQSSCWD